MVGHPNAGMNASLEQLKVTATDVCPGYHGTKKGKPPRQRGTR
jgi:hypothetical protein